MTDNAERWRNVAQAAQWLAEGREVEMRWRNPPYLTDGKNEWVPCEPKTPGFVFVLRPDNEYRLKPEPPKPREWIIPTHKVSGLLFEGWRNAQDQIEWVRVIEAPK